MNNFLCKFKPHGYAINNSNFGSFCTLGSKELFRQPGREDVKLTLLSTPSVMPE
jgi:hypothetical protein